MSQTCWRLNESLSSTLESPLRRSLERTELRILHLANQAVILLTCWSRTCRDMTREVSFCRLTLYFVSTYHTV